MSDFGKGFKVRDVEFRVADCFRVNGSGFGGDGFFEFFWFLRVDEDNFST